MGVLSNILGGGDVIKKGFDLIDSMHTSDEEAIEAKSKAKVEMLKGYAPFKVAQRYLALMFSSVFLGCFIITLLMTLFGEVENAEAVKGVLSEFWIGEIVVGIVGFYFGGGFMESRNRKS